MPRFPNPILVVEPKVIPLEQRLHRPRPAELTVIQREAITALEARPEGPLDLADEHGRRLIPAPAVGTSIYNQLRAFGLVEMVKVPCLCRRARELCACPREAFRLAKKSNVIHAAHLFRPPPGSAPTTNPLDEEGGAAR